MNCCESVCVCLVCVCVCVCARVCVRVCVRGRVRARVRVYVRDRGVCCGLFRCVVVASFVVLCRVVCVMCLGVWLRLVCRVAYCVGVVCCFVLVCVVVLCCVVAFVLRDVLMVWCG